jgi:hypothetical protein
VGGVIGFEDGRGWCEEGEDCGRDMGMASNWVERSFAVQVVSWASA